jgi:phosphoserine phosphatase
VSTGSNKLLRVELLPADQVIRRIEAALSDVSVESRDAALAFDGDGTLWSGDVGEDFFHATVALGRFLPPAVEAMRAVGRAAGLAGMDVDEVGAGRGFSHDAGVAIARRVFDGYLERKVPEDVICEVIAYICAGWTEDEVKRLAHEVVERTGVAGRLHRQVGEVLAWSREARLEAFLVSASPRPIVEAASASCGFDRDHILAATARFADGVMLPEVIRPIPYGPGKAVLLAKRLEGRTLLAAFGDNVFDVPMLQAARVAVVVEPKERLLDCLAALPHAGAGFRAERPPVRLLVSS